ncbi:MAG: hypothetical protein F4Y03_06895 [Alphaproteobacteria bacterium]|nr:hypothetical protein [Alphaproteobacteria bacterium]
MVDTMEMSRIVEGLPTKSSKIRALDAAGCKRAEIARFLGIRYQHVRNVLVQGPPKSETRQSAQPAGPGDVASQKLRIGEDGRLVIPSEMRAAMLVDETGVLTARVVEGELRVLAPDAALARLQKMVREAVPEGVSLADELIAERRAEARREAGE